MSSHVAAVIFYIDFSTLKFLIHYFISGENSGAVSAFTKFLSDYSG